MIKCPLCGSWDISGRGIIESTDNYTWRNKRCMNCAKWFKTVEFATTEKPERAIQNKFLLRKE